MSSSSSSSSSSSRGGKYHLCSWVTVWYLLCGGLTAQCWSYLGFAFLQERLRCCLVSSALLFSSHPGINYWADFGTLLGLKRGQDIIWSDVDVDLSMSKESRLLINDNEEFKQTMAATGFTVMEPRDSLKLRLHHTWGWFVDLDVWDLVRRVNHPTPEDKTHPSIFTVDDDFIANVTNFDQSSSSYVPTKAGGDVIWQMLTGRLAPPIYQIDAYDITPARSMSLKPQWIDMCADGVVDKYYKGMIDTVGSVVTEEANGVDKLPQIGATRTLSVPHLRIPRNSESILEYWYGASWHTPISYDKGKDASQDMIEVFFQAYFLWFYKVALSVKVWGKIVWNAISLHPFMFLQFVSLYATSFIALYRSYQMFRGRLLYVLKPYLVPSQLFPIRLAAACLQHLHPVFVASIWLALAVEIYILHRGSTYLFGILPLPFYSSFLVLCIVILIPIWLLPLIFNSFPSLEDDQMEEDRDRDSLLSNTHANHSNSLSNQFPFNLVTKVRSLIFGSSASSTLKEEEVRMNTLRNEQEQDLPDDEI